MRRGGRPRLAASALALAATVAPALAAPDHPGGCFAPPERVTVAGPAGPATLVLADGRRVRLADIRIAEPGASPPARAGPADLLAVEGAAPDRYGRIPGDIVLRATGQSLSLTLLTAGLAFVDPAVMQDGCHDGHFAAERRAEAGGRGIWSRPGAVHEASSSGLERHAGRYAIVDGEVASVGRTRRTVYLNFGADYRTDFTALIRRRDAGEWLDELDALEGRRVRIRGVLEAWNGGLIRIEHPAQIEARDGSVGSR